MKKRYQLIFTSLLFSMGFLLSTTVFAEEVVPELPKVVEEQTYTPISVERKNIDGVEYLLKVYEVPTETEQKRLEEADFQLETFLFSHFTTEKEIKESKELKEVIEETIVETGSNDMGEVLRKLSSTKEFNQDGYIGNLNLDIGSIVTEVKGYTNQNHTISTVREVGGLMYADPSFVPQTAIKNGTTLPLTNVNWVVTGTGLSGDTLVPTEYKAVASYSKSFTKQVPTGYLSTARYVGDVTKTNVDMVIYNITYEGKVIKEPIDIRDVVVMISTGMLLFAFVFGGGAVAYILLKGKQHAKVYNLIETEFVCLGKQVIDTKKPLIDLNEFEDMIQSNSFAFVLDKQTTKQLFGKNMSVTLKDITVKHRVNGYHEEYRFELELGGILDAE